MAVRGQYNSLPPRKYPALILVQHGSAVIDGKPVKLLHIERESEWEMRRREKAANQPSPHPADIPKPRPGRPRKYY